jgi:multidrug efflux pump subunit AcrB
MMGVSSNAEVCAQYPFFIIMLCLVVMLIGVVNIASMPVDLFPKIDMPVVVVATFYNGMPPQQIEADITNTFERFFTLGANIDHSESRSLTGVSLIQDLFQAGHGRVEPAGVPGYA